MYNPVRPATLTILLSLITVPVLAAPAVTITPDRIYTGHGNGEFIPRFATYLPKVLLVPAGQTLTLPPDSTWDAIEVAGTLRVERDRDTTVRFTHLTILPGGTLDAGTTADPILANAWFVVRDVPIDTSRDPYQFGNGIINLGRQTRVGRTITPFTELTQDALAGATQIRLAVPASWRVGDELFLPDTRQLGPRGVTIRRERRVFVAAIAPGAITLSKPLDFEHWTAVSPNGAHRIRPRVVNLTRNIVIVSANPRGTRGHTIDLGHHASWDVRYNVLDGLGRTRNTGLDSATADAAGNVAYIGTNQVGRYAEHKHHTHGLGSVTIGNVLHGTQITKWGHAVHFTSDTVVEGNVALDFPGAGFVTEDGPEVRNAFRRNFVAFSTGNGKNPSSNANPRTRLNCPGCEGAGFWFHGVEQTIEGNESWNNVIGVSMFQIFQVLTGSVPSVPGGPPDTPYDPRKAAPVSFADNVTVSNKVTGHEYWGNPSFPSVRPVAAYNGQSQAFQGQAAGSLHLVAPILFAQGAVGKGVSSAEAYTANLKVEGLDGLGYIGGCDQAFSRGGSAGLVHLEDVTLQCRINVNFNTWSHPNRLVLERVTHLPLPGHPRQFVVLGNGSVWTPDRAWLGTGSSKGWVPPTGTRFQVIDWQGTGRNYLLFEKQQKASTAAWPAWKDYPYFCPELITMGECWSKYGLSYGREAIDDVAAVGLDGLINGVAREGLESPIGPPRAVFTYPNLLTPAIVQTVNGKRQIRSHLVLTGDPRLTADSVALVQIDDGPVRKMGRGPGQRLSTIAFWNTAAAPGTHTVRTWRLDASGNAIATSKLEFQYYVEAATVLDSSLEVMISMESAELVNSGETPSELDGNTASTSTSFDTVASRAIASRPGLQYEPAEAAIVTRYTIRPSEQHEPHAGSAWIFAGSDDGVVFDVLDARSGQKFAPAEERASELDNAAAYRLYRLTWTAAAPGRRVPVGKVQLFGVAPVRLRAAAHAAAPDGADTALTTSQDNGSHERGPQVLRFSSPFSDRLSPGFRFVQRRERSTMARPRRRRATS